MIPNASWVKGFIGGLKTNRQGLYSDRKVVVFESDDWGAIRTPSREVLRAFRKQGFDLTGSLYKVDALASRTDLEDLFDVLLNHKNSSGKSPVFTANAIMANPDFGKIAASDFLEYHFEPFTNTFLRYPEHATNLELWKKGLELGVFVPEYHGREHVNINRWLQALAKGDERTLFSFRLGSTYSGKGDYAYMESFDWDSPNEVSSQAEIIREGARLFTETFGKSPRSFIAPCYNWDPALEQILSSIGISWIQGLSTQLAPTGGFDAYRPIRHHFGQSNGFGSRYNVRNVFFEPVNNPDADWTDAAMARIQAAFLLKKPAVICTHRLNYVGYIDPKNKSNGLYHLNKLLRAILKKWPDVDFVSTPELSNVITL
ncbi:hypothetical protein [Cyclobacterium xiamenense]|uniref:hypothetical protein n=1 Tax=Cyclobacterium xiamenense TaxID=1297121 RepID=UPI0012B7BA2A|nr:hypothetical protein [Cyclobacterium xiamenense]